MGSRPALLLFLILAAAGHPSWAQTCNVPSQRPTVQSALLDPGCSVVNVAAGVRAESVGVARSVTIIGNGTAATTILGRILVRGAGTVLVLSNLTVDARGGTAGCYLAAVDAEAGATVRPGIIAVINGFGGVAPCPLFADSFDFGS